MDFFKLFSIRIHLKRKYKILLICSIIFIILLHILSLLGYCASEVEPDGVIEHAFLSGNTVEANSSAVTTVFYWNLQKNHKYTLTNTADTNRFYTFSDEVPAVGITTSGRETLLPNSSITFVADDDYVLFGHYADFTLIDNGISKNGMSLAIGNLITGLPSSDIWSVFTKSLPLVLVCVVVGFGNFIINRNVKKLSVGGSSDTYKRKGYYNKKKGYYYNASAASRAKARGKAKIS